MGKDRNGRGPKWARTEVGIVRTEVGATFGIRTEVGNGYTPYFPSTSLDYIIFDVFLYFVLFFLNFYYGGIWNACNF